MFSPKQLRPTAEDQIYSGALSWDNVPQQAGHKSSDMDWGAPSIDLVTKTDDLELKWSDDENGSDSEGSDGGIKISIGGKIDAEKEDTSSEAEEAKQKIDIMAQQLKFVACLKILMEELSTLATGFEVDGKVKHYCLIITECTKPFL